MIIYFDTETTGLAPGGIIQLSYIMQDKNGARGKNFYFFQPYISPDSTAVHGVTVEKLAQLSLGKIFEDYIDEIEADFNSADLTVAHNFPFDFKEKLDTMRYFTPLVRLLKSCGKGYKYPKLCELAEFFEVYDYDASRLAIKLFGSTGISHDARFDIAQTYLCVLTAQERYEEVDELIKKYL